MLDGHIPTHMRNCLSFVASHKFDRAAAVLLCHLVVSFDLE